MTDSKQMVLMRNRNSKQIIRKNEVSVHATQTQGTASFQVTKSESVEEVSIVNATHHQYESRLAFHPRVSKLDHSTLFDKGNEFRGFINFFWIAMMFNVLQSLVCTYSEHGVVFRYDLAKTLFRDYWLLFTTDAFMVVSTFAAPILQMLFVRDFISMRHAFFFRHMLLSVFMVGMSSWIFYNDFTWSQSGSLACHTISMYMKMHSYLSINEDLHRHMVEEESGRAVRGDQNGGETYPRNVTLRNFGMYLLFPTLVYQLNYPRTSRYIAQVLINMLFISVRITYVFQKVAIALICISSMYTIIQTYIDPVLSARHQLSAADAILKLIFPYICCMTLIFFVIFEAVCNFAAEITRFADREFYEDWWNRYYLLCQHLFFMVVNSTTWDEFARKWNKPVHSFLLRHVYLTSILEYRLPKTQATFLTFFFSSVLHELVMALVTRKIRFYFFFLQMLQLPLIMASKIPAVRRRRMVGNLVFWFGLMLGPPLITVMYVWDASEVAKALLPSGAMTKGTLVSLTALNSKL